MLYHLVESAAFRELMVCTQPHWKIATRHYLSEKPFLPCKSLTTRKCGPLSLYSKVIYRQEHTYLPRPTELMFFVASARQCPSNKAWYN